MEMASIPYPRRSKPAVAGNRRPFPHFAFDSEEQEAVAVLR